ncbi:MAG: PAS domain-containing protein [Bacteroidetes bacterium]|nr:PAS domain-containing protein [Bacteroidota bacterium]
MSLQNERQMLHNFFMQAPAILAILKGSEHVFEFANPAYIELIGNRNPFGKTVREALPEIEGQGFYELLDNVYTTGEAFVAKEMPASLNRNGKLDQIYVNFSYQPFKDEHGKVEGILVFAYEVTELVSGRKKIEESENQLRFMAESMPQKIFTAKPNGEVDYFNPQWSEFTGLSFEQIRDWGWLQFIHPADKEENIRIWQHSIDTGEPFRFEHRFRSKEGEYRWHLSRAHAMRDENGTIIKWFGSNTDVHDLKKVQEQLTRSYEDLETKVKFRNIELEKKILELQKKIDLLENK